MVVVGVGWVVEFQWQEMLTESIMDKLFDFLQFVRIDQVLDHGNGLIVLLLTKYLSLILKQHACHCYVPIYFC